MKRMYSVGFGKNPKSTRQIFMTHSFTQLNPQRNVETAHNAMLCCFSALWYGTIHSLYLFTNHRHHQHHTSNALDVLMKQSSANAPHRLCQKPHKKFEVPKRKTEQKKNTELISTLILHSTLSEQTQYGENRHSIEY